MQIAKEHIEKNIKDFFQYVEQTGEPIIITDQNKIPVLKLSRFSPKRSADQIFKDIRGKVKYQADILEPETEEWEMSRMFAILKKSVKI